MRLGQQGQQNQQQQGRPGDQQQNQQDDQKGGQRPTNSLNSSRDSHGQIDPQDARSLRNQAGQDLKTADALRQAMQQAGIKDMQNIDEYIKSLQALAGDKVYNDPRSLQALQANALEKIQKVELDLRKRLDRTSDQLFLNGSQDVPAAAKALVDEYYKRIGKGGGK
jgi:hypothetical protein